MCWPLIAMGAMAAVSAYGQQQLGQAEQRSAEYNAKVQENNALAAKYQSSMLADRAVLNKRDIGLEAGQIRSKGRNTYAAGNVSLTQGSVFDWEQTMDERKAQDVSRMDTSVKDQQWALQSQALGYLAQADLTKMRGKDAANAGMIGAGGSLLGGAAKAYSMGAS